jgi:hypothetical protein
MELPIEIQYVILSQDFSVWRIARFVCKCWDVITQENDDLQLRKYAQLCDTPTGKVMVLPTTVLHGICIHNLATYVLYKSVRKEIIPLWKSDLYLRGVKKLCKYYDSQGIIKLEVFYDWCIFVHTIVQKYAHIYVLGFDLIGFICINCREDYSVDSIVVNSSIMDPITRRCTSRKCRITDF